MRRVSAIMLELLIVTIEGKIMGFKNKDDIVSTLKNLILYGNGLPLNNSTAQDDRYTDAVKILNDSGNMEFKSNQTARNSAICEVVAEILLSDDIDSQQKQSFLNAFLALSSRKTAFLNYVADRPEKNDPEHNEYSLNAVLEKLPFDIQCEIFLEGKRTPWYKLGSSPLIETTEGKNAFKKLPAEQQLELLIKFPKSKAEGFVADFSADAKAKIISVGLEQKVDEIEVKALPTHALLSIGSGSASAAGTASVGVTVSGSATTLPSSVPVTAGSTVSAGSDAKTISPASPTVGVVLVPETKAAVSSATTAGGTDAKSVPPTAGTTSAVVSGTALTDSGIPPAPPFAATASASGGATSSLAADLSLTASAPEAKRAVTKEVKGDSAKTIYALEMFQRKLDQNKEKRQEKTEERRQVFTHLSNKAKAVLLYQYDLTQRKDFALVEKMISSIRNPDQLANALSVLVDKIENNQPDKDAANAMLGFIFCSRFEKLPDDFKVMFTNLHESEFIRLFNAIPRIEFTHKKRTIKTPEILEKKSALLFSLPPEIRQSIAKELESAHLVDHLTSGKEKDQKITLELAVAAIPEHNNDDIAKLIINLAAFPHSQKTAVELFKQLAFEEKVTTRPPESKVNTGGMSKILHPRVSVWLLIHTKLLLLKNDKDAQIKALNLPKEIKHLTGLNLPLVLMGALEKEERAMIAGTLPQEELETYLQHPSMNTEMGVELAIAAINGPEKWKADAICKLICKLYDQKRNVSLKLFKALPDDISASVTRSLATQVHTVTRAHIWLLIKARETALPKIDATAVSLPPSAAEMKTSPAVGGHTNPAAKVTATQNSLAKDILNSLDDNERAKLLVQLYNPATIKRLALGDANELKTAAHSTKPYITRNEQPHPFRQINGSLFSSDINARIAALNAMDDYKVESNFKASLLLDAYRDLKDPQSKKEFAELMNSGKLHNAADIFAAFMLQSPEHATVVLEINTKLFNQVADVKVQSSAPELKDTPVSLSLIPSVTVPATSSKDSATPRTILWKKIHESQKGRILPLELMKYFDEAEINVIVAKLPRNELTAYLKNSKMDKKIGLQFAEAAIATYGPDDICPLIMDLHNSDHCREMSKTLFKNLEQGQSSAAEQKTRPYILASLLNGIAVFNDIKNAEKKANAPATKVDLSPKATKSKANKQAPMRRKTFANSVIRNLLMSLEKADERALLFEQLYCPEKSKALKLPVVVQPKVTTPADSKADAKTPQYDEVYRPRNDRIHPFHKIHNTQNRVHTLNAIDLKEKTVSFQIALLLDAYRNIGNDSQLKDKFTRLFKAKKIKSKELQNKDEIFANLMLHHQAHAIAILDVRQKKNGPDLLKAFADPNIIEVDDKESKARLDALDKLITSESKAGNGCLSRELQNEYFKCLKPLVRNKLFERFMLKNPAFAIEILESNRKWKGIGPELLKSFADPDESGILSDDKIKALIEVLNSKKPSINSGWTEEVANDYFQCLELGVQKKLIAKGFKPLVQVSSGFSLGKTSPKAPAFHKPAPRSTPDSKSDAAADTKAHIAATVTTAPVNGATVSPKPNDVGATAAIDVAGSATPLKPAADPSVVSPVVAIDAANANPGAAPASTPTPK